jgi:hypothetical protein
VSLYIPGLEDPKTNTIGRDWNATLSSRQPDECLIIRNLFCVTDLGSFLWRTSILNTVTTMCSPYRSLRRGDFRLLAVTKGAHGRDLRFQFKEAVPSQTQQYTAISYTWGNDAQTETIHVDGHSLRIKPSLWACLYTLRRYCWQYIWADAVCTYSYRTAMNYFRNLRIIPQFSEGFNFC